MFISDEKMLLRIRIKLKAGLTEGESFWGGQRYKTLGALSIWSNHRCTESGKIWGGQWPPWPPRLRRPCIITVFVV